MHFHSDWSDLTIAKTMSKPVLPSQPQMPQGRLVDRWVHICTNNSLLANYVFPALFSISFPSHSCFIQLSTSVRKWIQGTEKPRVSYKYIQTFLPPSSNARPEKFVWIANEKEFSLLFSWP